MTTPLIADKFGQFGDGAVFVIMVQSALADFFCLLIKNNLKQIVPYIKNNDENFLNKNSPVPKLTKTAPSLN